MLFVIYINIYFIYILSVINTECNCSKITQDKKKYSNAVVYHLKPFRNKRSSKEEKVPYTCRIITTSTFASRVNKVSMYNILKTMDN